MEGIARGRGFSHPYCQRGNMICCQMKSRGVNTKKLAFASSHCLKKFICFHFGQHNVPEKLQRGAHVTQSTKNGSLPQFPCLTLKSPDVAWISPYHAVRLLFLYCRSLEPQPFWENKFLYEYNIWPWTDESQGRLEKQSHTTEPTWQVRLEKEKPNISSF